MGKHFSGLFAFFCNMPVILKKVTDSIFGIGKVKETISAARKKNILLLISWRHSPAREWLLVGKKNLANSLSSFNLLNYLAECFSKVCFSLGLKKAGLFWKEAFVETNGVKRHVLVRYLMKELFMYFFISFVFFFMVFFVNQILLVAEKILQQHVPVSDVLRLILYSLPMIIAQSAPFATLLGFLMCLGRIVTENEILILRASGQSYRILLIPVLVLGLLISVGSFFVNDYLLPLGNLKYNQLYRTITKSNPGVILESNSIKRTNDKTLVVGQVDDKNISDMVFFDTDNEGRQRIIVAGQSSVEKTEDAGILMKLLLHSPSVFFFAPDKWGNFDSLQADSMDLNIFESSVVNMSNKNNPREMTSYDLYKQIKKMETEEEGGDRKLNLYKLEFNKKFSLPFGSIFFAFLALPLALIFGKHNGQTIGMIIGIFICVLYWALTILGQIFGNRAGFSGFWTMWAPDFLVGISAVFFYVRLLKR